MCRHSQWTSRIGVVGRLRRFDRICQVSGYQRPFFESARLASREETGLPLRWPSIFSQLTSLSAHARSALRMESPLQSALYRRAVRASSAVAGSRLRGWLNRSRSIHLSHGRCFHSRRFALPRSGGMLTRPPLLRPNSALRTSKRSHHSLAIRCHFCHD